jgi:hypothetical protein
MQVEKEGKKERKERTKENPGRHRIGLIVLVNY